MMRFFVAKNYILTGNSNCVKAYDFDNNKEFQTYLDEKNIFRDYASDYDGETGKEKIKYLEIETKKPICPSESEIRENLPSRSAKMRVARRV